MRKTLPKMGDQAVHELVKTLDDHIRTIHLTLMALALLLLPAVLATPRQKYDRPISDLKIIMHLREKDVQKEVEKEIDDLVASIVARQPDWYQNGERILISVQKAETTFIYAILMGSAWVYVDEDVGSRPSGVADFGSGNLAEFARFWSHNEHSTIGVVRSIESRHVTSPVGSDRVVVRVLPEQQSANLGPEQNSVTELSGSPLFSIHDNKTALTYWDPQRELGFMVQMAPDILMVPISLQELLRARAKQENNWVLGPFEKSFPELHAVSTGVTKMPLDDLMEFLRAKANEEQERSSEQIDLFGAKIPADKLGVCGMALLAGAQVYLWLHIRRLRQALNEAGRLIRSIAWIGGARDLGSECFVALSALALPLSMSLLLGIKVWGSGGAVGRTVACLSVLGSAFVTGATFTDLRALPRTSGEVNPGGQLVNPNEEAEESEDVIEPPILPEVPFSKK